MGFPENSTLPVSINVTIVLPQCPGKHILALVGINSDGLRPRQRTPGKLVVTGDLSQLADRQRGHWC